MLIRLVRTYLPPYTSNLVAVVLFQFVATGAMLYLPTLNADIIDGGVANGDTGYILRVGGVMLVVTVLQVCTTIEPPARKNRKRRKRSKKKESSASQGRMPPLPKNWPHIRS